MAVAFRNVGFAPLAGLNVSAPDGCIIGVIGEKGCGQPELFQLAAGRQVPSTGDVIAPAVRRYLGVSDSLNLAPAGLLLIDHAFSQADALVRARALMGLERLRGAGCTVLLASQEPALLTALCDELWWLEGGKLKQQGDPAQVWEAYLASVSAKLRAWGETLSSPFAPALRKGNGQAEILALETAGSSGRASAVLLSGEEATVRVTVRYREPVAEPVVGIMIRTRIGLEVYGTNTQVEQAPIGACAAGDLVQIEFRFLCALCPKEYTLTAASHDPDGTAHDWVDDAVSFVVTAPRSTAGVANLAARVTVQRPTSM